MLNRGGHFEDAADTVGLGELGNARGVGLADFDNDGDIDLLLTHQFEAASLYQNDQSETKNWVGVALTGDGQLVARDAIGARITVRSGDQTTHSWIQPASGFSAQGDRRLVVGIPESTGTIRIVWPDGVEWTSSEIEAGRYYSISRVDATTSALRAVPLSGHSPALLVTTHKQSN